MLIFESVLYVVAYAVAWFFAVILSALVLRFVGINIGLIQHESDPDRATSTPGEFVIFFLILCASIAGSYFILGAGFGYYPPFAKGATYSESNIDIPEVVEEANSLRTRLSNPDELTISELNGELNNAVELVRKLQTAVSAREQRINSLSETVEKERRRAEESRAVADSVAGITANQLAIIGDVVAAESEQQRVSTFWTSVISSFVLGVITSLIGNWLWHNRSRISHWA